MIESEIEMTEEVKREALADTMDTQQDHVTGQVTVDTGQLEVLRNANGEEEMKIKSENKLNMTLQDFCGLATAITGIN